MGNGKSKVPAERRFRGEPDRDELESNRTIRGGIEPPTSATSAVLYQRPYGPFMLPNRPERKQLESNQRCFRARHISSVLHRTNRCLVSKMTGRYRTGSSHTAWSGVSSCRSNTTDGDRTRNPMDPVSLTPLPVKLAGRIDDPAMGCVCQFRHGGKYPPVTTKRREDGGGRVIRVTCHWLEPTQFQTFVNSRLAIIYDFFSASAPVGEFRP